jgi:hypothetical protein
MALHMNRRSDRARRIGALCGALGAGLIGFAIVSTGGDGDRTGEGTPPTSTPTVLGAVVTPDETLPGAAPASAVTIAVDEEPATSGSTSPPATTTPAPTSPPPTPPPTEPPPTLVPPTVIENTTTTSSPTTTAPPPTTEPDPGGDGPEGQP